jgi:hypothetical protein
MVEAGWCRRSVSSEQLQATPAASRSPPWTGRWVLAAAHATSDLGAYLRTPRGVSQCGISAAASTWRPRRTRLIESGTGTEQQGGVDIAYTKTRTSPVSATVNFSPSRRRSLRPGRETYLADAEDIAPLPDSGEHVVSTRPIAGRGDLHHAPGNSTANAARLHRQQRNAESS